MIILIPAITQNYTTVLQPSIDLTQEVAGISPLGTTTVNVNRTPTVVVTPTSSFASVEATVPLSLTETLFPETEEAITITPESAPLVCGTSHPPIAGSEIKGVVTITNPSFTGDCIGVTEKRLLLETNWVGAPPGANLWVLVYSPVAKLYFPHFCVTIQNESGGQSCLVILDRLEPYEVIVILANASAHAGLLAIRENPGSVFYADLPTGITEMSYISLVRIK
jgi:hypothetical protein